MDDLEKLGGKIMKDLCKRCVSTKKLLEITGIPHGTLEKWMRERDSNGLNRAVIKLSRKRMVDLDQFNEWLNNHREAEIEI